jgi:RNA polymerase sigma-70 factor (ECF subfamily)
MEIQASQSKARVGPSGEPILLLDQDRTRWDRLLIGRGLMALERVGQLGGTQGLYAIQAAIAACHAGAATAGETDWARIAMLYGDLAEVSPSPVVELNRAVAVGMAAGLELVDALRDEPALQGYHLLPSVRGDLLKKLGRLDEARVEFERTASMTRNARERDLLLERAKTNR